MLNARWNIPVLTWLYENVICDDGSVLSMLDFIALLAAIPATLGYKIVAGKNLFPDAQAGRLIAARNWDELMAALTEPAMTALPASGLAAEQTALQLAAKVSAAEQSAVAFQSLAAYTRTISFFLFCLREAKQLAIFNEAKICVDWITYICSIINMSCVTSYTPTPVSTRFAIDSTVTSTQVIIRVRDSYLALYKRNHNADSPLKATLCTIESVFGAVLAFGVCLSLGLQLKEEIPPDIKPETWRAELGLKFTQNFMTSFYRSLAFVSALPAANPYRAIGTVIRGSALGIRAVASIAWSSIEIHRIE